MKILYLHGIGSGADSRTPQTLRKLLPEAEILAPELPIRPAEAYDFIKANYFYEDFDLVIGTSLGGFYAQAMPLQMKLLVNPAMYADEDISKAIGYGNQQFLCSRSDGATKYEIDEEFIRELAEIRKKIYGNRDILYPEKLDVNECKNTYALFGRKDTTVSHYEEFGKWYLPEQVYLFDGGHRLTPEEIETELLPLVKKVSEETASMCFITEDLLEKE